MKKVNQYGPSDPNFQKCAAEGCDNQIRSTPCERKKGQHMYCSAACAYKKALIPRKYSKEVINWLIANFDGMTIEDMAKKLHSSVTAFKRMVSKLRLDGHKIPHKSKSILTPTQKAWIAANFNLIPLQEIAKAMNLHRTIVKSWLDHQLKTGLLTRTKSFKRIKISLPMPKPDGRSNRTDPSNRGHNARKPPVLGVKSKEMDRRLPNRVVDTSGCIKIVFNDKNKTTFYARDEEHEKRIRVTYGYLEKDIVARLG